MGRIRSTATDLVFGRGFEAELANRGIDWLAGEVRAGREPQSVATTRLRPGESYTVVAHPKPTRSLRKLAAASARLHEVAAEMSRPTRRQRAAARDLARAQRRRDRRRGGARRHRRARARAGLEHPRPGSHFH